MIPITTCFALLAASFAIADDVASEWKDHKITKEQPFPARVIAIEGSWDGYELLLEELGVEKPRYCYVTIGVSLPMRYVLTTREKSKDLKMNKKTEWAFLEKPIEVSSFSWGQGVWKLGAKFGEEDLLRHRFRQRD